LKRTNAKLGHDCDDVGEVLDELLFLIAGETHERLQGALDGHLRASPFVSANVGIGISAALVGGGGSADEVVVIFVVAVGGGGVRSGGGGDIVTGGVDVRVAGFVRSVHFGGGVRGGVRGEGSGAFALCVRGGGGFERVNVRLGGVMSEHTRAFHGEGVTFVRAVCKALGLVLARQAGVGGEVRGSGGVGRFDRGLLGEFLQRRA
jgi:hypothetical protein